MRWLTGCPTEVRRMDSSVIYDSVLSLCNRFIMSRLYPRGEQSEIANSMMDLPYFPCFPYFVKTRKIRKIQCDIFVVDLRLTFPLPLRYHLLMLSFCYCFDKIYPAHSRRLFSPRRWSAEKTPPPLLLLVRLAQL